jgi:hypothetical protein
MRKNIVFYLCIMLPVSFVYAKPASDSIRCHANIEKIFKVLNLKVKYEAFVYFYDMTEKNNKFRTDVLEQDYRRDDWMQQFKLFTSFSLEEELHNDSVGLSGKTDMGDFVKQLYYPTKEAWYEYKKYIWFEYLQLITSIKAEKEQYFKCIESELAKGELSEYAHKEMAYDFYSPLVSVLGNPPCLSKLDYLEVFKEFILNDDGEVLPEGLMAVAYLKCGCKIPYYHYTR